MVQTGHALGAGLCDIFDRHDAILRNHDSERSPLDKSIPEEVPADSHRIVVARVRTVGYIDLAALAALGVLALRLPNLRRGAPVGHNQLRRTSPVLRKIGN